MAQKKHQVICNLSKSLEWLKREQKKLLKLIDSEEAVINPMIEEGYWLQLADIEKQIRRMEGKTQ